MKYKTHKKVDKKLWASEVETEEGGDEEAKYHKWKWKLSH